MKPFALFLVIAFLLIACGDAPTQLAPTATAAPFVPVMPNLIEHRGNGTADTPPEFKPGLGGEVQGLTERQVQDAFNSESLAMYKMVNGLEGQPVTFADQADFDAKMKAFRESHPELEFRMGQDLDSGTYLVYCQQKMPDGKYAVYYDVTEGGVLAYTDPMWRWSLDTHKEPVMYDGEPVFLRNATDGFWYGFDADGSEWFATAGATVDNLDQHMVEVEKELITDVRAWAKEEGEKAMNAAGISVDTYMSQVDASLPDAEKREAAYRLAWAEFLAKRVVGDPRFDLGDETMLTSKPVNLPWGEVNNMGLVVGERAWSLPNNEYLEALGVEKVLLIPMAFEETYGPTPMAVAYYDGSYEAITAVYANGGSSKAIEMEDDLPNAGDMIAVKVINVAGELDWTTVDNPNGLWSRLESAGSGNDPNNYFNLFQARSVRERELLALTLFDPNSYTNKANQYKQGYSTDLYRHPPEDFDPEWIEKKKWKMAALSYVIGQPGFAGESWLLAITMGGTTGDTIFK